MSQLTNQEIRETFNSKTPSEKKQIVADLLANEENQRTITKSIKFANKTFVTETVILDKDWKFICVYADEKVISDADFLKISTICDKL